MKRKVNDICLNFPLLYRYTKMPRKRRNRKNRRKNYKQHENVNEVKNKNEEIPVQKTPKKSDYELYVTLPNETPLRTSSTPSLHEQGSFNSSKSKNNLIISTTPMINKKCKKFFDEDVQETPKESNSNLYVTSTSRKAKTSSRTLSNPTLYKLGDFNNSRVNKYYVENNSELKLTNLHKPLNENEKPMECLNNITPKCSKRIRNRSVLNESYINDFGNSISGTNLLKNRRVKCVSAKERSKSSMSKLHTPGLDRIPVMIDVSTQTVYFNNDMEKMYSCNDDSDVYLQSCINIFETPKINQMEKLDTSFDLKTSNLSKILDLNISNRLCDRNLKYKQNFNELVMPNSYVSPKIIQNDIKNNESDGEMSFFNSQAKIVSTPMQKLEKNEKIFENMAKNILNSHLQQNERMEDYVYNISTPKTPNNKNINSKFEDKIYTQKISKHDSYINKRRIYNSVSPKFCNNTRNSSVIRTQSCRNNSNIVPKTFSPQRISPSKSDSFLNVSDSNVYARFMTNVKKLHSRYSSRWLARIIGACSQLGISIKRGLSSLCPAVQIKDKTVVELNETMVQKRTCSNCNDYQKQIVALALKVNILDKELYENKEKIATLYEAVGKMKEELLEIDSVKQKIKEIEDKFEMRLLSPTVSPPPPPPPIPPPPPLPPLTLPPTFVRNTKILNKENDKNNCGSSRPVISLDEILNVKLKKTSDKPPITRRATQPIISIEMLKQIKLRPTSRPETPSSIRDISPTSSLSSSPATSLTKLLSNVDTNVRRVKRLRRGSRYSLDDSRKYTLKRERFGNDDS